jgi:hypothetical protein
MCDTAQSAFVTSLGTAEKAAFLGSVQRHCYLLCSESSGNQIFCC